MSRGRQLADRALLSLVDLCCESLREVDLIARYAEDELAILLADAPAEQAQTSAERLLATITAHPFPAGIEPRVAVGYASFPADASSTAMLVDRAREAMVIERRSGKGQARRWSRKARAKTGAGALNLSGVLTGDPVRDWRNVRLLLDTLAIAQSDRSREEILGAIVDRIVEFIGADRGILFLADEHGELEPEILRDRGGADTGETSWSQTVPRSVFVEREPVFMTDASRPSLVEASRSIVDLELRTLMCAPLEGNHETLGVLYVDGRAESRQLQQSDLTFFHALTREVARAIELASLRDTALRKAELDRDLSMAQAIHSRLLPASSPAVERLDLAGQVIPARELGGDYFDFLPDAPDGSCRIVIGDVTGKGVGAALVVAMVKSSLEQLHHQGHPTEEMLVQLGQQLHRLTARNQFMSMVLASWHPDERKLVCLGAGHEHILICREDGTVLAHKTGGIVLGIGLGTEERFQRTELHLSPGDTVLFYTDGAVEALDPEGNQFGIEALEQALAEAASRTSAADVIASITTALALHQRDATPHDDITLVALRPR
jgi:serine phosphatase RsbU (regulator of sigma subunit)